MEELCKLYRNSVNGVLTAEVILLSLSHHRPENPARCIRRRCWDSLRFWFLVLDSEPPPPPPPLPLDGPRLKWKQMKLDVMRSCGEGEPVL